ncbi:MAG: exodeoxyribonuclease III, partial [Verrucomicrobiota bacterium]|nr:exodeoxyribonuclease III [Verrucomicrobiota bacterium]
MKIYSWNVNGIRACREKGFLNWLEASQADVVFLQETKAHQEQLCAELVQPPGYETHWFSAEKKGYSSVAAYCRTKPDEVQKGLGHGKFDIEGRSITVFYGKLAMIGAYFPNSQDMGARLGYKMEFCQAMLEYCRNLRNKGYSV